MARDLTKDIEKMSREELIKLRKQVDKAIDMLADRERKAALKAAEDAAKAHGFSLAELGMPGAKAKTSRPKSAGPANPPKFRNPNDPDQTWTGRGRRPQWVKDAEAAGVPLETMAI